MAWALAAACLLTLTGALGVRDAEARAPAGFWQKSLRSFKAQDEKDPAKGGVVFVGSSSIRLWQLASSFPALPAVNRGLGGAQIDDVLHFIDPLVFSREPKVVVFYAGENDIGAGADPEQVVRDFRTFVSQVETRLPGARILFLSIKPSPVLRALWPRAREANRRVEELAAHDAKLRYVDVSTSMLGRSGKPRRELFREDGLHMNAAGYRLWTQIVSPVVEGALAGR